MHRFIIALILLIGFFVIPIISPMQTVSAEEDNCLRFVTLVNPVRGRNLWGHKTLKPIQDQYSLINKDSLPATWLLQYDAITDGNLTVYIKEFDENQEKGLLLEISPKMASDAKVIYPQDTPWANPNALFLSGYGRKQRVRLIDTAFSEFRKSFGDYPKSVGAWWVDSYSIGYMKRKYNISAVLIVADQKTTDKYGVWGQWWGVPYYPSETNLLVPAGDDKNKTGVVVIQWAQRDLTKAYGEGPDYSNYSLQANDYTDRGLDTGYFSELVDIYLDCGNRIGQVTVGLETGMESISQEEEYKNQLESLLGKKDLNFATMSEFAQKFTEIKPENGEYKLEDSQSEWILNTEKRSNQFLGENINYDSGVAFRDYFIADKSVFLKKWLPLPNTDKQSLRVFELLGFALISYLFYRFAGFKSAVAGILFAVSSYGLIFRSDFQKGWAVFYSTPFDNLLLVQVLLFCLSLLVIYFFEKSQFGKNGIFLLPLSFGIDAATRILRISRISGEYLIGFAKSEIGFVGLSLSRDGIGFVNENFNSAIAASLLKINYDRLFLNPLFSVVIYPLFHIIAAYLLLIMMRKASFKYKISMITVLVILWVINICIIFRSDPLTVNPLI